MRDPGYDARSPADDERLEDGRLEWLETLVLALERLHEDGPDMALPERGWFSPIELLARAGRAP